MKTRIVMLLGLVLGADIDASEKKPAGSQEVPLTQALLVCLRAVNLAGITTARRDTLAQEFLGEKLSEFSGLNEQQLMNRVGKLGGEFAQVLHQELKKSKCEQSVLGVIVSIPDTDGKVVRVPNPRE